MSARSRHRPWFLDGAARPPRPAYVAPRDRWEIELIPVSPAGLERVRQFEDYIAACDKSLKLWNPLIPAEYLK